MDINKENKKPRTIAMTRAQKSILKKATVVVSASYLIDSSGNVFDINIYQSSHGKIFNNIVKNNLNNQNFKPAPTNELRQPVRIQTTLTFGLRYKRVRGSR